ncbi:MAG: Hsp70 family protein, partial [Myxococcota bacterium]
VEQGLDPHEGKELGAVYLVGGAASFPLVGRLLRARFQRKVRLAPEPHAATAVGLAVAADPDASIFVREATTRHFGVWREASAGRELVFDALLGKDVRAGSDGAVVVERQYRPAHNVGHLRFVECTQLDDNGRPEGDMTPFGELYFPYAPELADGRDLRGIPVRRTPELEAQEIVERYVYEADGRLRVEIENRTGAYRRELTLGSL